MSTHFVLVTQDMQERRIPYSNIAPYVWWVKAYGRESSMPPKTVATHAHGWPVHTIDVPSLVLDEFVKIFNGVTMPAQAWKRVPRSLGRRGYTITEWHRCLTRYELADASAMKRKREDGGDEDEEEAAVPETRAPPRKKARVAAEPILSPLEIKAYAVGKAFGKYARNNHPDINAFLNGELTAIRMEFLAPVDGHADVSPVATTIEVDGFGVVPLLDYLVSCNSEERCFKQALEHEIHPCAMVMDAQGHTINPDAPRFYDEDPDDPHVVQYWPGLNSARPAYTHARVLYYIVGYRPTDAGKRKR